jgi:hypothetical protein
LQPEKDLSNLLKGMSPKLNEGKYVFAFIQELSEINLADVLCIFKEGEGITIVIEKNKADELKLKYDFVAAWITLEIHSSLEAIGFTAAFSDLLTKNNIGCNVVAAYHHDHIFVDHKNASAAIKALKELR